MNKGPFCVKYSSSVFDCSTFLLGSASWRRQVKIKPDLEDKGKKEERRKEKNWGWKEENDWLCGFWWYFRVKFCQDLLNIHSPLFYDNEQTNEFDFNLKWRRGAVGGREWKVGEMRRWKYSKRGENHKKCGEKSLIEGFQTDKGVKIESLRLSATVALNQNLSLRQLVIECWVWTYSVKVCAHTLTHTNGQTRDRSHSKFAVSHKK